MRNAALFLKAGLLALAAVGTVVWALRSFGPSADAPPTEPREAAARPPAHRVVVTYFTTNKRCATCMRIETLTRETITTLFAEDLAADRVRFRSINFDTPEHRHYAADYELTYKTVVISEQHQGVEATWEKCDQVWGLHDDPPAFTAYLEEAIRRHLPPDSDA